MAFRWWADDGPQALIVLFGSTHPLSTKKTVKVGPPLTNFFGSSHECNIFLFMYSAFLMLSPSRVGIVILLSRVLE